MAVRSGQRDVVNGLLCHPDMWFPEVGRSVRVPSSPSPLDRERRTIAGDKPPEVCGFCGANVRGTFYVFAGCNENGYTNKVLELLSEFQECGRPSRRLYCWEECIWEGCSSGGQALTASPPLRADVQRGPDAAQLLLEENPGRQGNRAVAAEQPLLLGAQGQVGGPGGLVSSPWIQTFVILSFPPLFPHRLIYFGGYGCKTVGEMQNTPAANFVIEELSWVSGGTLEEPLSPAGVNVALVSQAVIENTLFRCWGWNNEVNVFDTHAAAWSSPAVRVGTSQAGAASVAAHAQPVLCSPGIPAHAQRLPRQRPAGEQGLHHRRRGESTRPGEEFALRSNIAGE